MRFTFLLLLCAGAVIAVSGQQVDSPDEHRFVAVPGDQGLILVVSQPDCPLRFEDVKLLVNMKGAWVKSFKVRNQGTKPIRNYTIAAIASDEWSWEAPNSAHHIMPGQTAPPLGPDNKVEVVPLTKALREKLKLQGPMKGIVALIVVRLEYDDGSVFEEEGYESQKEYFERLYGVMNPSEGKAKRSKLAQTGPRWTTKKKGAQNHE
ncbi:MAG TPA: hypothetical protein VGJ66_10740 [Pyrinomonadaceae bacterium]|jgi:hypothetical protein